jgi:hypothetical protein
LLRLLEYLKPLFKARPIVWGHLQKAHRKLIVGDPSHGGQLDLHGL